MFTTTGWCPEQGPGSHGCSVGTTLAEKSALQRPQREPGFHLGASLLLTQSPGSPHYSVETPPVDTTSVPSPVCLSRGQPGSLLHPGLSAPTDHVCGPPACFWHVTCAVTPLKSLIMFEQGAPHAQFALDAVNYTAGPGEGADFSRTHSVPCL